MQRRRRNASRNVGDVSVVSDRALIRRAAPLGLSAKKGTSPQRKASTTRSPCCSTTSSVGATLNCSPGRSVAGRAWKIRASSSAERGCAKRPHIWSEPPPKRYAGLGLGSGALLAHGDRRNRRLRGAGGTRQGAPA